MWLWVCGMFHEGVVLFGMPTQLRYQHRSMQASMSDVYTNFNGKEKQLSGLELLHPMNLISCTLSKQWCRLLTLKLYCCFVYIETAQVPGALVAVRADARHHPADPVPRPVLFCVWLWDQLRAGLPRRTRLPGERAHLHSPDFLVLLHFFTNLRGSWHHYHHHHHHHHSPPHLLSLRLYGQPIWPVSSIKRLCRFRDWEWWGRCERLQRHHQWWSHE